MASSHLMSLSTFAFLHSLESTQLQWFREAMPGVEFLLPGASPLPAGVDRAEGAALSWNGPATDDVLAAAPRLQWLHQRGAGIDGIATPKLIASDVVLTNGSGNSAINIAEHVLCMMFAFARQLPALVRAQAERRWQPLQADALFELSGQTLAVIGAGAIGAAVAQRASALGMTVVGVRRTVRQRPLPQGMTAVFPGDRIDDAVQDADHVVITLPLTAETRCIFSSDRMAAMKRGAYLYNVGRGGTVDQEALLAALRRGHLAGAGLDVTDPEPLPAESPLWLEPQVLKTAHSSGLTPRSFERYRTLLVENMRRFDRGDELLNVVDKSVGY